MVDTSWIRPNLVSPPARNTPTTSVVLIAAFVFHAPVQVVYILLMSDEVIKVPITVMRYRSYKWIQNVTREKAELA